jgi:hypothetical protein
MLLITLEVLSLVCLSFIINRPMNEPGFWLDRQESHDVILLTLLDLTLLINQKVHVINVIKKNVPNW